MKKLLFLFSILYISGCSCERVPVGYAGVKVHLLGSSKGDVEVIKPGRYWIGFNEDLFLFPLFKQTYPFTASKTEGKPEDESFFFQANKGLQISADIGITLTIQKDKVVDLFTTYRTGIDEIIHNFLRNILRDAFNEVASAYSVEDLYGDKKTNFTKEVLAIVQNRMAPQGILVEDIHLLSALRLPANVMNAVQEKIQATQKAEKSENELRTEQAEAKKRIVIAEGDALALKAKAEGEAAANKAKLSTIDQKLIDFERMLNDRRAIDKWNGQLPQTMCGNATPFIAIK
jgi:regulator of protease activity HflC (stomatin/prohibitin superfamily)